MVNRRVLLVDADRGSLIAGTNTKPYFRLLNSIKSSNDYVAQKNITLDDLNTIEKTLSDFTTFFIHGTWSDDVNTKSEKIIQKFIFDYAAKNKKELVVLETNLLSRIVPDQKGFAGIFKYHRIGLDSWLYNKGRFIKNSDQSRFEAFKKKYNVNPRDWKKDGDYVLVILGFEGDPSNDLNPVDFINTILPELKSLDLKIKIRPHPLTLGNTAQMNIIYDLAKYYNSEIDSEKSFEKSLNSALFCAMYNSTSIFQAIWNGIPCYTNINNFGYNISIKDLSNFSSYSYPDRTGWFTEMSWLEYTREEMFSPSFWPFLVENLLDANFNNN